jgi:hypothetical protein
LILITNNLGEDIVNFNNKIVSAFCITATIAVTTNAEFTGSVFMDIKAIKAVDGFGAEDFNGTVIDLWAESDDLADVLLNVYDFNDVNLGITYYQSFTGGTWLANNQGPPFETPALMIADSYVSIGSYNDGSQPSSDDTGLDPNFGGTYAAGPQANAGWYNGNPNNPIGEVKPTMHTTTGLGVFIGRFSIQGESLLMAGGTGVLTWKDGSNDYQQATFLIVIGGGDADSDGDGIPDNQDECPYDSENDADGDGICGDVDTCPYDFENDADGDGICGDVDTCPNDSENDADGDGICGDVDTCPNDSENDADGDGICGDVDAFPYNPNEWADSDEDGIGDNEDNYFENYAHFACCVTSSCFVGTDVQCTAVGGTWIVEDESCDDCVAPPETCDGDINADGVVDIDDLLLLISYFGNTCM